MYGSTEAPRDGAVQAAETIDAANIALRIRSPSLGEGAMRSVPLQAPFDEPTSSGDLGSAMEFNFQHERPVNVDMVGNVGRDDQAGRGDEIDLASLAIVPDQPDRPLN